jgi:hypothetical protein
MPPVAKQTPPANLGAEPSPAEPDSNEDVIDPLFRNNPSSIPTVATQETAHEDMISMVRDMPSLGTYCEELEGDAKMAKELWEKKKFRERQV